MKMPDLQSKSQSQLQPKAIVIGAGSGIGMALAESLARDERYTLHTVSRHTQAPVTNCRHWQCDNTDQSISDTVSGIVGEPGDVARLIVCNGVLHGETFRPERAIKQVNSDAMAHVLRANTIVPTLWLGAFIGHLRKAPDPRIAVLSARVGSIGDNQLGGWYSYRASKAALNMVIQTAAIELARVNRSAKIIAFHPGTTDTPLSAPFQKGVPEGKLFTPAFVADRLLTALDATESGAAEFLDWDGQPIPW